MNTESINYKNKVNKMSNVAAEKETSTKVENPMITVDDFKLKKLSVISTFSDNKKIDKAVDKFRKAFFTIDTINGFHQFCYFIF